MSPSDAKPPSGPPSRLYKYRSLAEGNTRRYTLAVLENLELSYAPASRFNDPFDCNLDIAFRSSEEWEDFLGRTIERLGSRLSSWWAKVIEAGRARLEQKGMKVPPRPAARPDPGPRAPANWDITITGSDGRRKDTAEYFNSVQVKRMREFHKRIDESFGVLCLCEPNDDLLLWSHYANGHDGLCLEFDAAGHPDAFPRLHPVSYQHNYPDIPASFPDLLELYKSRSESGMEDMLVDTAYLLARDLPRSAAGAGDPDAVTALAVAHWFYVKSSHWGYEREWRCLKRKPGPQPFPAEALTGVIVGCVNTEANLELVGTVLKERKPAVPLYKARRKPHEFGVDIVRADS